VFISGTNGSGKTAVMNAIQVNMLVLRIGAVTKSAIAECSQILAVLHLLAHFKFHSM